MTAYVGCVQADIAATCNAGSSVRLQHASTQHLLQHGIACTDGPCRRRTATVWATVAVEEAQHTTTDLKGKISLMQLSVQLSVPLLHHAFACSLQETPQSVL